MELAQLQSYEYFQSILNEEDYSIFLVKLCLKLSVYFLYTI
jgi:hypothetical protein